MTSSARSAGANSPLWLAAAGVVTVLVLLRWWAAAQLPLLGDEAYYWWAGQHLNWSYSDLPPATAWLTRLGVSLFGHSYFGVRWPFLLLGLSIVPLLRCISAELGIQLSWIQAWSWAGLIPLLHATGTLALPEAPLIAVTLLLVWQMLRCQRTNLTSDWLIAGLIGAIGWLIHIRFAWVAGGLACAWLMHPPLRATLTTPGPWLGAVVSLLGLVPMIWFNVNHDLGMLQFQMIDRHPWAFQPLGLLQPVVQMIFTTPVLYVVAFLCAWHYMRAKQTSTLAIATLVIVPWLFIWLFGTFADQERTTYHWPAFVYVAAIPLVAMRLSEEKEQGGQSRLLPWVVIPGLLVSTAMVALMIMLMLAPGSGSIPRKLVIDNVLGWREVSELIMPVPRDVPVIADNFMTAAQLAFESRRDIAGVMHHPLNEFHGRSRQLDIWGLGESRFDLSGAAAMVWEETAIKTAGRLTWLEQVCQRFDSLLWLDDMSIRNGKKRFILFEAVGSRTSEEGPRRCDLPPLIELVQIEQGQDPETIRLSGWAIDVDSPIDRVEIWTDQGIVADAKLNFGGRGALPPFPEISGHQRKFGFVSALRPVLGRWIWARVYVQDGRYRDSRSLPVASLAERARQTTLRLQR